MRFLVLPTAIVSIFPFFLLSKTFSFHWYPKFWEEKKSAVANCGEYGGWGKITVLFLAHISLRPSIDVWAGALSWYKIHDWFFYNSMRFWRIASRNRRITSRLYSLSTARPCGKTLWCTMPFQSKKTVSKTFTFDRTWRVFFCLGSSGRFHWDDWALISMS